MYDCSFNFATIDRHETFNRNASGGINVGRDTVMDSGLRFDRVCRVTENAVQEAVWDLTVVGNPAFIANGLAVHNTRWAVSDLYSHIMQTDPSVECMTRSIVEDGVPIWPEKISLKHVADLRKEYGSLFHLLYMNNAGDPELTDFSETDLRYYTIQGDNLVFDENEMDLLLHDKEKAPARPSPDGLRGMPLTGDVYEMEFSAREEYLRFRMRP